MDAFQWIALCILVTVLGGLPRIFIGPTRADSMLAAQLSGTGSVAILILLGLSWDRHYLFDVALVFAILAAIAAIAFVSMAWNKPLNQKTPSKRGE